MKARYALYKASGDTAPFPFWHQRKFDQWAHDRGHRQPRGLFYGAWRTALQAQHADDFTAWLRENHLDT